MLIDFQWPYLNDRSKIIPVSVKELNEWSDEY